VQCVVMRRVAKRNRQEVFRHRRLLARRGSEGRQTKTPTEKSDGGLVETPFLTLLVPRRRVCEGYRGRSPDSRIILLANAFPAMKSLVAYLLAFVPDYSGASVRELHPLPSSSTSIAATANIRAQLSSGATDVKDILLTHS